MQRISDEGKVRCVPSVVEVVGESDGLKTEGSFSLREGGIGKKYAGYGPPRQQGDGHHHVRCHSLTIVVDHEDTVRDCSKYVAHCPPPSYLRTDGQPTVHCYYR